MTLKEIKDLKDKVYELEGLLELAQLREDKLEELTPLIISRLNSLSPTIEYKVEETEEMPVEESYDTSIGGIFSQSQTLPTEEKVTSPAEQEAPVEKKGDLEKKLTVETEGAQKPLFCLNDRFRFRRTLFDGSEPKFAEAMKRITQMDNFDEAKEYFMEDYGWDPEDEEVIAFLEIIKSYFTGVY